MRKVLILEGPLPPRADWLRRLAALGFEIVRPAAGKAIAERAADSAADIVIMHGAERLAEADEVVKHCSRPIVLLPSETDSQNGSAAMAYLIKPLAGEELWSAIELSGSDFAELASLKKENEELRKTLEARKMIERAKGLLMKNRSLTEAEAFALIQKKSMDMRRPMVDIAQAIVLSEEITKEKAG